MTPAALVDRIYTRMAAAGQTVVVTYKGAEFQAFFNVGDEDNGTAIVEGVTLRYRVADAPNLTAGETLVTDGETYRVDDPGRGQFERTAAMSIVKPQYSKIP